MEFMVWIIILIVMIVLEVVSLGLTTIWFAGGALVAAIAAALHLPIAVQIILFFLVSIALLIFTRPIAMKYFNKDRIRTNAESLVGKQAVVLSEINNIQGVGQVSVNGQEWSARSMDENATFHEGEVVEIVAISGVKLIVKAK